MSFTRLSLYPGRQSGPVCIPRPLVEAHGSNPGLGQVAEVKFLRAENGQERSILYGSTGAPGQGPPEACSVIAP